MLKLDAKQYGFLDLNKELAATTGDCVITGCTGQRFIGAGSSGRVIDIRDGVPGNALGAYLNGSTIIVNSNAQDAVGDTMNDGRIIVHGNIGDTAGYAMRGGAIFVRGDAGYRAGIHIKAYQDKIPALVIGGRAGSFLGEYQAGGIIIVLGMHTDGKNIVGNVPCTGMHGGKMFLRSDCKNIQFPSQVSAAKAEKSDLDEIRPIIEEFCSCFGKNADEIMNSEFTVVTPDSKNPYKQMYVAN